MFNKKILTYTLLFLLITTCKSFGVTVQDTTDSQYLNGHGHSPEAARIINLQKMQINGEYEVKERFKKGSLINYLDKHFQFINFFKKQVIEPDLTESGKSFGESTIYFKD